MDSRTWIGAKSGSGHQPLDGPTACASGFPGRGFGPCRSRQVRREPAPALPILKMQRERNRPLSGFAGRREQRWSAPRP